MKRTITIVLAATGMKARKKTPSQAPTGENPDQKVPDTGGATGAVQRRISLLEAASIRFLSISINPCSFMLLFLCCLVSCNPMRRIDMKNHSSQDVEITWTLKEGDSLAHSPFFMNSSTIVKYELKPTPPYNEVKLSFGEGSWPRLQLESVTRWLESLEIKYDKGTILLDSSEEIYSFLFNRRKGIGKRKIEILIQD